MIIGKDMKKLKNKVRCYLKALYTTDFPKEGICHHLGVDTHVEKDYVGFCVYGGKLLITVYASSGTALIEGYSCKRHTNVQKALLEVVQEFYPKSECSHWNGETGHDGISVYFTVQAPDSLLTAIGNYHAVGNVFKFTEKEYQNKEAFDAWLEKKLKVKKKVRNLESFSAIVDKKLKHEARKAKTHLYKTKTTSCCGLKRKNVWRIVNPEIFDKISEKGRCVRCQKARNKQK